MNHKNKQELTFGRYAFQRKNSNVGLNMKENKRWRGKQSTEESTP